MTVDGTDFRIQEPVPFCSKWYSHKFNGPGLRYEVGVCIQTGWIVWLHGPFPCGKYSDRSIFRRALEKLLDPYEKILADGGYQDAEGGTTETPNGLNTYDQYMKQVARARHETINKRFKDFAILNNKYRGNRFFHIYIFTAIANLVQVDIEIEKNSFMVVYDDITSKNY
jgi:DDE superfamily endonuclease